MAADAPASVPETMDPVLFAWGSSEEVMTRLATGTGSVLVITKALNREAVVANSCLLGPLMKEHGALLPNHVAGNICAPKNDLKFSIIAAEACVQQWIYAWSTWFDSTVGIDQSLGRCHPETCLHARHGLTLGL